MPNKYLEIFDIALDKYSKPTEYTRGYSFSFFTRWRHSFKLTPYLQKIRDELATFETDERAKTFIQEYLSKATLNYHSFASYFIDELAHHDSANGAIWASFDAAPVIYYKGKKNLYRGMRLNPTDAMRIFNKGIAPQQHYALQDYVAPHNFSAGCSTSKKYTTVLDYAAPLITDPQLERGLRQGDGWVLEINPQALPENSAIDIVATNAARSHRYTQLGRWFSWFSSKISHLLIANEEEVNLTQGVPAKAIVRLFKVNRNTRQIERAYVRPM